MVEDVIKIVTMFLLLNLKIRDVTEERSETFPDVFKELEGPVAVIRLI